MIVEMPTVAQAGAVAQATAGQHLPATQEGRLSRCVELGPGFEVHRAAVKAVSVLFKLYDDEGNQVRSGWMVTGARFEVEWPEDRGLVSSHFGARRYASTGRSAR
jgi:putative transposase